MYGSWFIEDDATMLAFRRFERKLPVTVSESLHCMLGSKERSVHAHAAQGDQPLLQPIFRKDGNNIELTYPIAAAS